MSISGLPVPIRVKKELFSGWRMDDQSPSKIGMSVNLIISGKIISSFFLEIVYFGKKKICIILLFFFKYYNVKVMFLKIHYCLRYENGEEEHCLELWNRDGKGLKWNDSPCSFETFFVCEVQWKWLNHD